MTIAGTASTLASTSTSTRITGDELKITLPMADTVAGGETVTVALSADAIVDRAGNGIAAVAATTVTTVPGAPTVLTAAAAPTVTPQAAIALSWTTPASDGGSAITRHQYRQKSGSGSFGAWTDIATAPRAQPTRPATP